MKWFEEITKWSESTAINHTYLMDDSQSKIFAYVRSGHATPFEFKKPIRIDGRGRKFREVNNKWTIDLNAGVPQGRVFTVIGSRGDQYTVNELDGNWTCTCSGFKFRGSCRHIKDNQS